MILYINTFEGIFNVLISIWELFIFQPEFCKSSKAFKLGETVTSQVIVGAVVLL